jgi:hypothetical protein
MCLTLSALYQISNFNINSVLVFNVEEYPLPHISKILLLYSCDCKQFMEVMITFRELLEEITRCKVGNYLLLTYLLTPWSRVLLEKLTGSAASQEIPCILLNPKVQELFVTYFKCFCVEKNF